MRPALSARNMRSSGCPSGAFDLPQCLNTLTMFNICAHLISREISGRPSFDCSLIQDPQVPRCQRESFNSAAATVL